MKKEEKKEEEKETNVTSIIKTTTLFQVVSTAIFICIDSYYAFANPDISENENPSHCFVTEESYYCDSVDYPYKNELGKDMTNAFTRVFLFAVCIDIINIMRFLLLAGGDKCFGGN